MKSTGVLRHESKVRARAIQLLYAWELQSGSSVGAVAERLLRFGRGRSSSSEPAEVLAKNVLEDLERLDGEIEFVADKWPLARIGTVERNILRLGLYELLATDVPPKVVIDEGVQLAHWFAGNKASAFVNGVLDALARRHGRL